MLRHVSERSQQRTSSFEQRIARLLDCDQPLAKWDRGGDGMFEPALDRDGLSANATAVSDR